MLDITEQFAEKWFTCTNQATSKCPKTVFSSKIVNEIHLGIQ